ncbi:687_t:CDS:1 [Funneliformis mosseae]|uniref:687_t:CDS:1 n=1 Tax=Funneliformis mosseae TaxID=27381 RepID=A0A9N9AQQ1_FUNMO|nr:687_t:CDS:1 [Funneliformis mosseae]
MTDLRVIQWSSQPKVKKRTSNPFLLFRNELKKYLSVIRNMQMTEVSKIASERWESLSEDDKAYWQRKYEINRDATDEVELVEMLGNDCNPPLPANIHQTNDLSYPVENIQFENYDRFCYSCQNLNESCTCIEYFHETNQLSCYPTYVFLPTLENVDIIFNSTEITNDIYNNNFLNP